MEDDGAGMTDSEIANMNQSFLNRNAQGDVKVGLMNINERIKLIFGNEYGVQIGRRESGEDGLSVKVSFPLL